MAIGFDDPVGFDSVVVGFDGATVEPPPGSCGFVDFVGYCVGPPPLSVAPPVAGIFGFVDFTGIPVGVPTKPRHGRGFQGAGKKRTYEQILIMSLLEQQVAQEQAKRQQLHEIIQVGAMQKLEYRLEIARRQHMINQGAMWTTLLSEI